MDDLIAALTILRKYAAGHALKWPTNCSHDVLAVLVDPQGVSPDDVAELERLGFNADDGCFTSFRFGSA